MSSRSWSALEAQIIALEGERVIMGDYNDEIAEVQAATNLVAQGVMHEWQGIDKEFPTHHGG